MAEWYDEQFGEYYEELPMAAQTAKVDELLFGLGYQTDDHALDLFQRSIFDNDESAYLDLIDYMWDEYGIDFEDAYSWDDFREWYDGQAG